MTCTMDIDPDLAFDDRSSPDSDARNADSDDDEAVPSKAFELPSFFAIEFPGPVKSVSRATDAVGGQDRILKVMEDPESRCLELRFRQGNRFEHPVQSTTGQCNNLVLKVTNSVSTFCSLLASITPCNDANSIDVRSDSLS